MNNIIDSYEQFKELVNWLKTKSNICVDIETNSLNTRTGKIIGIAIADQASGFYLCSEKYDIVNQELVPVLTKEQVKEVLLLLMDKNIWTFNAAFDLPFIKNYYHVDLVPRLHSDVLLMAHTLDENKYSYKLKDLAAEQYGEEVKKEQQAMLQSIKDNGGLKNEYYKADWRLMGQYAIQDAILTMKLGKHYLSQMDEDLAKFFFEDEVMPLYRHVTLPMEQHGLRLDMPLLQQSATEIAEDIAALEAKIQADIAPHLGLFKAWFLAKDYPPSRSGTFAQGIAAYFELDLPKTAAGKYSLAEDNINALPEGRAKQILLKQELLTEAEIVAIQEQLWAEEGAKYMFNLNSKHHLKKLFFDTLKCTPLSRTPTGAPQVDHEFLDSVLSKYAWVSDLIVYNKLIKIQGTYIQRFLDEQENGRFYARYQQHRTVSGRFGSDFQQLSRPLEPGADHELVVKHTNRIRNFFIADDNCVFIDADYESLEPHVFAHASGDEALKNIFRSGLDFYSEICIKTEGLQGVSAHKDASNYLGKLQKTTRQRAKAYALGCAYGLTGYKLQYELNIPLELAEKLVKGYMDAFPTLKKAIEQSHKECLELGFVKTETGRVRRFPRAKKIYEKYGDIILHDLELWKALHDTPGVYARAKQDRRELKNYLNNSFNIKIQGLAASMINRASIAMMKEYKAKNIPATIVASIHDETLVSCQKGYEKEAAKIMQCCMENAFKLSIDVKAQPIIGTRYGEVK